VKIADSPHVAPLRREFNAKRFFNGEYEFDKIKPHESLVLCC
jgi:hypothetical protein